MRNFIGVICLFLILFSASFCGEVMKEKFQEKNIYQQNELIKSELSDEKKNIMEFRQIDLTNQKNYSNVSQKNQQQYFGESKIKEQTNVPLYWHNQYASTESRSSDPPNLIRGTREHFTSYVKATSTSEKKYLVTLNIYSGRPNPTYLMTENEINQVKNIMSTTVRNASLEANPALGYRGFQVTAVDETESFSISGVPEAESYLTNLIKNTLTPSENMNVRQEIPKIRIPNNIVMAAAAISAEAPVTNYQCNYTPIKCSSDRIPIYNPNKGCKGCFLTRQQYNNCYNYSTDILTNTFAQPGNSKGLTISMSCKSVAQAAIQDGLKWRGNNYPYARPKRGHYVALVIWKQNDFHWLRLDRNGLWSHKPGTTPVINYDSDFKLIKNPANQNLSPYNFCGYMWILPSKTTIK
jgi:hypothetical protein